MLLSAAADPLSRCTGADPLAVGSAPERLRIATVVILALQCLVSFGLLLPFDPSEAGLQMVEQARWVHSIGLDYALAWTVCRCHSC